MKAETEQKTIKLQMSKEETLQLSNFMIKLENLQLQYGILINQRDTMLSNFCVRNGKTLNDIIENGIQQNGVIIFKDEEKKKRGK